MMKNISTFVATLFLIQVIIVFDFTSSVDYNCNPKKKCESGYEGSKVRDPEDCFSYYLCLSDAFGNIFPSDNSIKCQEGYYFSGSSCSYSSTCGNQCFNLCQAECTYYNYEKVADFKDCSSYYLCSPGGIKIHHKCPAWTPYFDGSECSKEKYVCCDCCDECTPYCESSYTEIADPYDCRSYYFCQTTGLPLSENKYTCKEGEYFNPSFGRCDTESLTNRCSPKCK